MFFYSDRTFVFWLSGIDVKAAGLVQRSTIPLSGR